MSQRKASKLQPSLEYLKLNSRPVYLHSKEVRLKVKGDSNRTRLLPANVDTVAKLQGTYIARANLFRYSRPVYIHTERTGQTIYWHKSMNSWVASFNQKVRKALEIGAQSVPQVHSTSDTFGNFVYVETGARAGRMCDIVSTNGNVGLHEAEWPLGIESVVPLPRRNAGLYIVSGNELNNRPVYWCRERGATVLWDITSGEWVLKPFIQAAAPSMQLQAKRSEADEESTSGSLPFGSSEWPHLVATHVDTYSVTVMTGSRRVPISEAKVFIVLNGLEKNTEEIYLGNLGNSFEAGKTDDFHIIASRVGLVKSICIGHDGTLQEWFLNKVIVKDDLTNEQWVFPCHAWVEGRGIASVVAGNPKPKPGNPQGLIELPASNTTVTEITDLSIEITDSDVDSSFKRVTEEAGTSICDSSCLSMRTASPLSCTNSIVRRRCSPGSPKDNFLARQPQTPTSTVFEIAPGIQAAIAKARTVRMARATWRMLLARAISGAAWLCYQLFCFYLSIYSKNSFRV
jgi:hypothetical protein